MPPELDLIILTDHQTKIIKALSPGLLHSDTEHFFIDWERN